MKYATDTATDTDVERCHLCTASTEPQLARKLVPSTLERRNALLCRASKLPTAAIIQYARLAVDTLLISFVC